MQCNERTPDWDCVYEEVVVIYFWLFGVYLCCDNPTSSYLMVQGGTKGLVGNSTDGRREFIKQGSRQVARYGRLARAIDASVAYFGQTIPVMHEYLNAQHLFQSHLVPSSIFIYISLTMTQYCPH